MTPIEVVVVLLGLLAVAWVNWYFFRPSGRPAVLAAAAAGIQEVRVVVQGGYRPAQVRVRAGVPVRMIFDRQETSSCSEEVVLPDFGVRRFLPAHAETPIEFTPQVAGTHEFTCGMGMLRGRLIVEEGA